MAKKGFHLAKNSPETLQESRQLEQILHENAHVNEQATRGKFYQGYFPRKGVRLAQRVFKAGGTYLRHQVMHTEAEMNWGDMSAESADLAFSILWNYCVGAGNPTYAYVEQYEHEGKMVTVTPRSKPVYLLYRAFHREVVAQWPADKTWLWTEKEME